MTRLTRTVTSFFGGFWMFALITATASYAEADVITTDVCIIGGGSSGIYAAVNLKAMGKNVVVVERSGRIGGHAEAYIDPATGIPINVGVVVYDTINVVREYAAFLNVSLGPLALGPSNTSFVDFRTGTPLPSFSINATAQAEAAAAYAALLASTYPYLDFGYNLPDPVPEDLLLSVADFFTKYSLEPFLYELFDVNQGVGDLLSLPMLYAIKGVGPTFLQSQQQGYLAPTSGDASEFYIKALPYLGSSVLLNSTVSRVTRTDSSVEVEIGCPASKKIIKAKKLIIAIPPTLYNLAPFDLSSEERSLFGQFASSGYWTGILSDTGIPDGLVIYNIGIDTPFNLPPVPAIYDLRPTGVPGLVAVKYTSPRPDMSDDEVKGDIDAAVERLRNAGFDTQAPTYTFFESHSPYQLRVSVEAIRGGFYRELYALQGQRSTFYIGAAFEQHDSSLIWNFTRALLPEIIATL